MMRHGSQAPQDAGQVKRITKTDALLAHIEALGADKTSFLPIGIRTTDLAEATGVPAASVSVLLAPHVKSGRIQMCKISTPGSPQQNEYRKGIGVPTDFKPLNTRRAGIARGATTKPLPVTTPAPSLSTPKPPVAAISTPVFIKPTQPEVVALAQKTPAAEARPPMRAEPAVAAQATPKPKAPARMKAEPAAPKASAGDVRIGINDAGTLVIAIDDDSIELNPKQAKRLGNFMAGTAGVWNPF